jgi:hypothetical protein
MLRFAIVMLLALVCRNGVAQEEFPFKALVFQGASAYRPGENAEYFLVKHGFLRGLSLDEEAAVIADRHSIAASGFRTALRRFHE